MAWTSLTFSFGSLLTSSKMTQLYDNLTALANGDSGAPAIQEAAMGSASVNQAALKTTTGEVSTIAINTTLTEFYYTGSIPGGTYTIGQEPKHDGGGSVVVVYDGLRLGSITTSYADVKGLFHASSVTSGSRVCTLRTRYIQSSPPYDLGDGQVHDFIFALVNKNGEVVQMYDAPDAPWHYNGPTIIRPDRKTPDGRSFKKVPVDLAKELEGEPVIYQQPHMVNAELYKGEKLVEIEMNQAYKNRDMELLPHPWLGQDLTDLTVIMLDPVSDLCYRLQMMREEGYSISDVLHEGHIKFSNSALERGGPSAVMSVSGKWKNKRK